MFCFYIYDFQVSIDDCTEGIVRVAEQTKTLNPRQQEKFEWQISAGMNSDFNHNCTGIVCVYTVQTPMQIIRPQELNFLNMPYNHTVVLYDRDGTILDTKPVHFKTLENCIYCSDGQCNCSVSLLYHNLHITVCMLA